MAMLCSSPLMGDIWHPLSNPLNVGLNTLPFYLTAHLPVPSPFGMVSSEIIKHKLFLFFNKACMSAEGMLSAVLAVSRCPNGKEVDCHRDRIVLQPVPWWPLRSGAPAGLLSTAVKLLR